MSSTPRLALPLLAPGQAQKELFHNEALLLLDFGVAPAVEELPRATPPASPQVGKCYIVAAGATQAWTDRANALASYTQGGWRFLNPPDGMSVLVRSTGTPAIFRNGAWTIGSINADRIVVGGNQVVGGRTAAIPPPSGGTTVDAEARAAINLMLDALRQHGLIAT